MLHPIRGIGFEFLLYVSQKSRDVYLQLVAIFRCASSANFWLWFVIRSFYVMNNTATNFLYHAISS